MKLRYLIVHHGEGRKSEPVLHYWDATGKQWVPVKTSEYHIKDVITALRDEHI